MKNTVMDIDISKDKIDYCLINSESHQVIQRGEVVNDRKELLQFLNKIDLQQTSFAMEHTGQYGAMYSKGIGPLTDKKKAFYLYKKSAEQGYAIAQHNLGVIYYTGEGTLTDKKQAAFWIRKSYENGFEKAKEYWDDKELYKY